MSIKKIPLITEVSSGKKTVDDPGVIDHIYKALHSTFGFDNTKESSIKNAIEDLDFGKDHEVDWRQPGIKRLVNLVSTDELANKAVVAMTITNAIKSSSLYEGVVKIKRQHTSKHPAITINDKAVMRNKLVNFLGDRGGKVSVQELSEYMSQMQEDSEVGRSPHKGWVYKNKHLVRGVKASNGKISHYKLTRTGRKVYNHINANKEEFKPLKIS